MEEATARTPSNPQALRLVSAGTILSLLPGLESSVIGPVAACVFMAKGGGDWLD